MRSTSEEEREELRARADSLTSPPAGPTTFGAVIEYLLDQIAPGGKTQELLKDGQVGGVVVHIQDLQGLQAAQRSEQPAWVAEGHYLNVLRRRGEQRVG